MGTTVVLAPEHTLEQVSLYGCRSSLAPRSVRLIAPPEIIALLELSKVKDCWIKPALSLPILHYLPRYVESGSRNNLQYWLPSWLQWSFHTRLALQHPATILVSNSTTVVSGMSLIILRNVPC